MPVRKASATWHGDLPSGNGTVSTQTRTLTDVPYSFSSRFEEGSGSNPEELLGAAHAGCFTMAVSGALARAGYPPTRAHTEAEVHLQKGEGGFGISRIHLALEAEVPGISEEDFQRIAEEAKEGCPLSKALRALEITLEATLKGS
jgi:lipoyl-dependent peroxiredoxin